MQNHRTHRHGARRALCLVFIGACVLSGCAHNARLRPGGARALAAVGTLVTVAGIVTAAGCPGIEGDPDTCVGNPSDSDLAVGIPVAAVGVAMLTAAVYFRSKGNVSPLSPRTPVPPPVLPDPFDKPLNPNP